MIESVVVTLVLTLHAQIPLSDEAWMESWTEVDKLFYPLDDYCESTTLAGCLERLKVMLAPRNDNNAKVAVAMLYRDLDAIFWKENVDRAANLKRAKSLLSEVIDEEPRNVDALRAFASIAFAEDDEFLSLAYLGQILREKPDSIPDHVSAANIVGQMTEADLINREIHHWEKLVVLYEPHYKAFAVLPLYRSLKNRGEDELAEKYKQQFAQSRNFDADAESLIELWRKVSGDKRNQVMTSALKGYCIGAHLLLVGPRQCRQVLEAIESEKDGNPLNQKMKLLLWESYTYLSEEVPTTEFEKARLAELATELDR